MGARGPTVFDPTQAWPVVDGVGEQHAEEDERSGSAMWEGAELTW